MNEVHLQQEDQVIEVRHWGAVSDDDVRDARAKVEELIDQTGISDVLVDLREVESFLDTVEIYEFASDFNLTMRVAMLYDSDDSMVDDLHFLETVAINRGNDFSMHSTRQDALEWLRP